MRISGSTELICKIGTAAYYAGFLAWCGTDLIFSVNLGWFPSGGAHMM